MCSAKGEGVSGGLEKTQAAVERRKDVMENKSASQQTVVTGAGSMDSDIETSACKSYFWSGYSWESQLLW